MSSSQTTRHLFLLEPADFYFNDSTAPTNPYQVNDDTKKEVILERALGEFRSYRDHLVANGIHVTCAKGIKGCPDHIFPNWFSTHEGRKIMIYPMLTENRAAEKTPEIIATLSKHYDVLYDWSHYESEGRCLEGVSSLILDRVNKVAYATLSARTDEKLAYEWCERMGYEPVIFQTKGHNGAPIYHSDVLMHIGTKFVGICIEVIIPEDRERVVNSLSKTHDIIELSMEQLKAFAGNALEVKGEGDKPMLVLSTSAYDSLSEAQRAHYLKYIDRFVHVPLPTIQQYGGGSARCMIQELF